MSILFVLKQPVWLPSLLTNMLPFSITSFRHHTSRSHTFLTSTSLPIIPFVVTLAFSPLFSWLTTSAPSYLFFTSLLSTFFDFHHLDCHGLSEKIFFFYTHKDTSCRVAALISSSTDDTASLSSLSLSLTHNQDSTSNTFYDNAANASSKESIFSINNINNSSNDANSSLIEPNIPVSPISTLPNECINPDSHNNIAFPKEPVILRTLLTDGRD